MYLSGLDRSYRPATGLAAARMEVRAFRVAWEGGLGGRSLNWGGFIGSGARRPWHRPRHTAGSLPWPLTWMPALAMEMVCCSIASWMATCGGAVRKKGQKEGVA